MRSPNPPGHLGRAGAFLLLALVAGCAVFGRIGPSLPEDMDVRHTQVDEIEAALIFGEIEAASASARWLAARPDHPDLPRVILGPTEDIRAFARTLLRSGSIEDAARSASEIAAACGRCHAAAGVVPLPAVTDSLASGSDPAARMSRLAWTVDRMWEAMVAADDERWAGGVSVLEGTSLVQDEGPDSREMLLAGRLQELGSEARAAIPERRAAVYGRILSTCAGCHALTGSRPRTPRM